MTAGTGLEITPTAVLRVKAALTRARSIGWSVRNRGRPARGTGVRILFYHRISDDPDELAVTPRRFREQMEFLASAGWRVVDVVEAGELAADGGAERTLGLSFDDGYRDVAENAMPVLDLHGFRASVFIATGVTDGNAAFEWYDTPPPLLSWEEIETLDGNSALRFEAHTVTHKNLLELNDDEARREIVDSRHALEQRLGRPVEAFCYPAGLFGAREREFVAEAGFRFATSCEPGVNGAGADPLALRRIQIDPRDAAVDFKAKIGGGHDDPLPLRGWWRRARYGARDQPAG